MRNPWRIILFTLVAPPLIATPAHGIPGLINYKGQITDSSGEVLTGPLNMTFTLWDAETGGTQLGAGFNDTDSLTPNEHGLYDTLIGDDGGVMIPDSVFRHDSVWLNVQVNGENLTPRTRLTPFGAALHAGSAGDADTVDGLNASAFIRGSAPAYVVVETTDNALTNGANLIAAYATARTLTPHGQPLGVDNRATVLVPPGRFDLGTAQLEMDTEFVDLVGLSTARENQHIYGTSDGYGTGVLRQTADDVKIENLLVELIDTGLDVNYDGQGPAAYFPDTALANTIIRNCSFKADDTLFQQVGGPYFGWSMRIGLEYAGYYEDCKSGYWSFGGSGNASGTFNNCTGGDFSFGSYGPASGIFNDCTAGHYSFGFDNTASGTFNNCTAGNNTFGSGYEAIASGTFINCTGGDVSFGSGHNSTASGTFSYCTGGDVSFGVGNPPTAAGGTFHYCSGGPASFPGASVNATIVHCIRDGEAYPYP